MVEALVKRNAELEARVAELERLLESSEEERRLLARVLANLQGRVYGRSSEKLAPGQEVFDFVKDLVEEAEAEVDAEEKDENLEEPTTRKPTRKKPRTIPKHIERERVLIDVDPELRHCSACDCEMQKIGEDVTTELDYVPARFIAREFVRPKYSCRACSDGVLQERLPKRPIEKGRPGLGLLTQVVVAKYVDHVPLYRQEKIFRRSGLEIPRSTLCDWIQAMGELLRPVWAALREEVLSASLIQADETPVRVLSSERATKGYIWTYGVPWSEVVFDFTEGRAGSFAKEFLEEYSGHLQCDGYSGYDRLPKRRIVRLGCWAHVRRKFYEARGESRVARSALASVQALYRTERAARAEGLEGEALVEYRRLHARPIIEGLREFLETERLRIRPKTLTGKALTYATNQWPALVRYVDIPEAMIDNNSAENSIRPLVLGRKNWLFIGHPNAGPRAATILSLVGTCERLRIDPHMYLRDLIAQLTIDPSRAADLTPRKWRDARAQKSATAPVE